MVMGLMECMIVVLIQMPCVGILMAVVAHHDEVHLSWTGGNSVVESDIM